MLPGLLFSRSSKNKKIFSKKISYVFSKKKAFFTFRRMKLSKHRK